MSAFDRTNGGRERRRADLFLADLLGRAPARPRRGPPVAPAPSAMPMVPAHDSAGRLFDRIVHGTGAGAAFEGEALDAAFEPVALPGSPTPPDDLRSGDLVVQRALGEGRLGCLRVLGEDAAVAELYDLHGRIRRDTLVLRGPGGEVLRGPGGEVLRAHGGEARAPAEDVPATPSPVPSASSVGGKLYRVISVHGGATTAVYVPEAARATDPVALLVWIHGDLACGNEGPDEGPDALALVKGTTFPLVQQLSDSRRPYVLVAPSMGWHSQRSHALGKPKAMNAFLDEVRSGLTNAGWTSAPAFGPLILAGHARAHAVLGDLAAGARDAAWSRGALAAVSDVWLLDATTGTAHRRDCDTWTAFAQARPGVRLRIFYRRNRSTAPMAECIRDAAAAAALGNVTVVDADPEAISHCEMPRAYLPELLGGLTDAGKLAVAPDRGPSAPSVPAAPALGASPTATPSVVAAPGRGPSAPSVPTTAFRRWYLTTYHVAAEPEAPGDPLVPVLTSGGDVIARVPAGFFAEMARDGRGRLRDGRLLTGDSWRSPAGHDYAPVLAVHLRRHSERNRDRHNARVSGITVVGGEVTTVRAYAVVPAAKAGMGYGVRHGIPLDPFKTLAADIGGSESSDERYRGEWSDGKERYVVVDGKTGLVPTGTRVYVRQLAGVSLPGGKQHDGWLVVNDTRPGIHGARFDVFVGEKRYGEPLLALTGGRFVDVWFDGIEARVPADYHYGFPRR